MVGEIVSHYKIIELLGGGGMGIVYKAHDLNLDRYVALKFLPPALSLNEESKKSIINEAKIAAKLNHPNICTIHEVGESEEGQVFISMSLYEGMTLKKVISKNELDDKTKEKIILQIANGIKHAHQNGIVHRDIKPANIFLTKNNEVKILDFGVAKIEGDYTVMDAESVVGTIAYMSPEQISGQEIDQRSDIWSFGVLVYELITGGKPFRSQYQQSALYAVLHDDLDLSGFDDNSNIDYLKEIVSKCLERNKEDRFQSFEEIIPVIEKKTLEFKKNKFNRLVNSTIFSIIVGFLIILIGLKYSHKIKGILYSTKSNTNRVAVLPFSFSFDADSIHESSLILQNVVVTNLINNEQLSVIDPISLNELLFSSANFQDLNTNININDILSEMGVEYYLKGNIQTFSKNNIVQSDLVKISNNEIIISENFSFNDQNQIISMGESIARKILDYFHLTNIAGSKDKDIEPFIIGTSNISALKLFLIASEYNYRAERDEVEKYLKLALRSDPKYISPRVWLISTLFIKGNINEAESHLDTVKSLIYKANKYEKIMISWAEALLNHDIVDQIRTLRLALEYQPNNNIVYYQLAYIYYLQQNYTGAIECLEHNIAMKWNYSGAYNLLGYCLMKLHDYSKAINILESALFIKPINEEIFLLLEIAYREVNDLEHSTYYDSIFVQHIMNSGLPKEEALKYSASVNLDLNFPLESIEDYRKILMLRPNSFVTHEAIGDIHIAVGDTQSAILEYQYVSNKTVAIPSVNYKLGQIYNIKNDPLKALYYYEKFVKSDTSELRIDVQNKIKQLKLNIRR